MNKNYIIISWTNKVLNMSRRYYTSRSNPKTITIEELYWKLQHLYLFFRGKDYFKGKAGITTTYLPDSIKHKAALSISFQPFPLTKWSTEDINEDHIFDVIEFLYDHVSKPGEWVGMTSDTGWNYYDYESYDDSAGQEEFRIQVNIFLSDYKNGYELSENGTILAMSSGALMQIFDAEIVPHDEVNVDSKVRDAI